MPNRKTFDEREKYDHSAHRTGGAERGDLTTADTNENASHHGPADDNAADTADTSAADAKAADTNADQSVADDNAIGTSAHRGHHSRHNSMNRRVRPRIHRPP